MASPQEQLAAYALLGEMFRERFGARRYGTEWCPSPSWFDCENVSSLVEECEVLHQGTNTFTFSLRRGREFFESLKGIYCSGRYFSVRTNFLTRANQPVVKVYVD